MNVLRRFFYKLLSRLFLLKYRYTAGIYLIGSKDFLPRKVLIYLNDPALFHLGDHFFIDPVVRLMRDNGWDISLSPLSQMEFYFAQQGMKIVQNPRFEEYDLVVTRIEFYLSLKQYAENFLILDTTDHKINQPICNYFLDHTSALFGLDSTRTSSKPFSPLLPYPSHLIDPSVRYLIFNNYIASSRFHLEENDSYLLYTKALEIANHQNLRILHTGTSADKQNDPLTYPEVAIDLRGKISVEELFAFTASDNVIMNISFDALGMHLFLLYNKPSFILFRGRFLNRNKQFVLDYLNPPFSLPLSERKRLINYIERSP